MNDAQKLQQLAGSLIDQPHGTGPGPWRHSQHWHHTSFGDLTDAGWDKALQDCRSEAREARQRAEMLDELAKVLVGSKTREEFETWLRAR